jgi:protein-S-isoprenylcysteine O-methyltransferase Ste14
MVAPFIQQSEWARLVFGCSLGAFVVGELSQAMKWRRGASQVDLLGEVLFRLLFFTGILFLPLSQSLAPHAVLEGAGPFVLGATIGWAGLLLRWWSFLTLGKYFTTVVMTSADQVVVSRGPYAVVRHPSYTGLLAVFLGSGLMFGNWVGACASFLSILVALVFRLLREERAMANVLGEAYDAFARDRARLIPFVW